MYATIMPTYIHAFIQNAFMYLHLSHPLSHGPYKSFIKHINSAGPIILITKWLLITAFTVYTICIKLCVNSAC